MRYKYWLILFVLVLAVCAALFTLFYNEVKKDAIKNLNNHQLVIAEQTKKRHRGVLPLPYGHACQERVIQTYHQPRQ